MKLSELVNQLGAEVADSNLSTSTGKDPEINGVAPVDEAGPGTLSYIEGQKFASYAGTTGATALVLPLDEEIQAEATQRGIAWIASAEPRLLFAKAIALFYRPFQPPAGIAPGAVIDATAEIGENVYIAAGAVIQARVRIGNNACIYPNAVVYPDAEIGDGVVLHANCIIHERSFIGKNCVIGSGTVVGGEGFGFVPTKNGLFKMEQSGRAVLEEGVEIGSNSTIDRPAAGETRIGKGTKIDNLVQIGHGCKIGKNCAIAAQAGLAGGVIVGNNVILAGQVGIANQVKIGDGATATAQAGIHKDVGPGEIVSDSPAIPYKLYLKTSAIRRRLPQIYQSLKQIERLLKLD